MRRREFIKLIASGAPALPPLPANTTPTPGPGLLERVSFPRASAFLVSPALVRIASDISLLCVVLNSRRA